MLNQTDQSNSFLIKDEIKGAMFFFLFLFFYNELYITFVKENDLQIAVVHAVHKGSHKNETVIGEKMVVNKQVIKLQTFDNNSRCKHRSVSTYMSPY